MLLSRPEIYSKPVWGSICRFVCTHECMYSVHAYICTKCTCVCMYVCMCVCCISVCHPPERLARQLAANRPNCSGRLHWTCLRSRISGENQSRDYNAYVCKQNVITYTERTCIASFKEQKQTEGTL